tara:strand:- start:29 stop:1909 length:1881 start_codon:yes stop_codon:yes gene_type:complete
MALTKIKTGGIADNAITDAKVADNITAGAATTAATLATARNINGVSFNGSSAITVTAAAGTLTGNTLASGVTASSLTSVGTLTGLTVQGSNYTTASIQAGSTTHGAILNLGDSGDIDYGSITQFASSAGEGGRMRFIAGTTEVLNLYSNGSSTFAGNVTLSGSSTTRYLFLNSGGNGGVWQEGNYELRFGTNDTERMKIEGDGTVVMNGALQPAGNVTIASNLTVNGTGSDVITGDYLYLDAHNNTAAKNLVFRQLDDTWLGQIEFHPTNKGWITTRVNQPLAFGVNNSEKVIIDTEGNVGIGSGSNTNARIVRGFSNNKGLVIETQQPAVSFVDTANTNNYMHIAYDNGTVHHYNDANGDMIFSTNSANKFIVQGDQDVITCIRSYVVGTSRPSQSLRFQGHHAGFGDGVRTFSQIKSIKANTVGGSVAGMLTFYTNDTSNNLTERLKIDNEGGLTSNTNNNDWIYHGTNLHGSAPYGIRLSWSNASPDSSSYEWLYFVDSSAERFRVSSDGDIVADGQAINSDENLKENIVDATDKLADVMKLKVRNFDWKEEYHPNKVGEKKIGFIAQEVEKIFPSLVKEVDSPINSERKKGIKRKTIQDAFTPILVKAIQELSAKVTALENA